MNLTQQLQAAFRAEMAARGLDLAQLADRMGISRSHVYGYFKPNANLTLKTVGRLADALGKVVVYRLEAPK